MTDPNTLRPVVLGLGPVVDNNGKPIKRTRAGAQRWGNRRAAQKTPKGFWHAVVVDTPRGWRVSFGGQPDRFR